MVTSFYRSLVAAVLLTLSACAPAASTDAGSVRFAVSTTAAESAIVPSVRVREVRVLGTQVNLQEPLFMASSGADVTVTFARRSRHGETLALAPISLEQHGAVPYSYAAPSRGPGVPSVDAVPERVALEDGGSISTWTDEGTRRVLVQLFSSTGACRGSAVAVSPEGMEVYGAPHLATADGRHVVVAFFASDEERFKLVAASIERTR